MSDFEIHKERDQLVISLEGPRVDISSVSELRKELLAYIEAAELDETLPGILVVDLGELVALDSTGVALMVNLQKKVVESGRRFQLRNVNETIHKMLQLSNLAEFFRITS